MRQIQLVCFPCHQAAGPSLPAALFRLGDAGGADGRTNVLLPELLAGAANTPSAAAELETYRQCRREPL